MGTETGTVMGTVTETAPKNYIILALFVETSGDRRRWAETGGDGQRPAETGRDRRRQAETRGDERRRAETGRDGRRRAETGLPRRRKAAIRAETGRARCCGGHECFGPSIMPN